MSKEVVVVKEKEVSPIVRPGGMRTAFPLCGKEIGAEFAEVGITIVAPGESRVKLNIHENQEEVIYVLEGTGTLITNEGDTLLPAGSAAFIPVGHPHNFWNNSSEPIKFMWIYALVSE